VVQEGAVTRRCLPASPTGRGGKAEPSDGSHARTPGAGRTLERTRRVETERREDKGFRKEEAKRR